MTPAEVQQQRLLERLHEVGDQVVAFAELHASGHAFPAAVVTELELNGYASGNNTHGARRRRQAGGGV